MTGRVGKESCMEHPAISVIIPIYKVEKYLRRCVESVLAQTRRDIEVILVDDGSPDGCGALCDELACGDERIAVVHKPNGGLSSARNAGLEAARGEYIGFVDGDDSIEPEMYETLLAALETADASLCICDYIQIGEDGAPLPAPPPLARELLTPEAAFERLELAPERWRYVTAVNRLYRRELFDTVRFREGKVHEDEFLAHEIFRQCGRIAVIPDRLYTYVRRGDSLSTGWASLTGLDAVEAFLERYRFYLARGLRRPAAAVLTRAYRRLWHVMDAVDVPQNRERLEPLVRETARALTCRLSPRGAYLYLTYRRRLRRGGEGGHGA